MHGDAMMAGGMPGSPMMAPGVMPGSPMMAGNGMGPAGFAAPGFAAPGVQGGQAMGGFGQGGMMMPGDLGAGMAMGSGALGAQGGVPGMRGGVAGGGGGNGGLCCNSACNEKPPEVVYLGQGNGQFIQETTYQYVGPGAGQFNISQQPRSTWPIAMIGVLALIGAVAVVAFVLQKGPGGDDDMEMVQAAAASTFEHEGEAHHLQASALEEPSVGSTCEGEPETWDEDTRRSCCANRGLGCHDAGLEPAAPQEPPELALDLPESSCLIWGDPHIETFDNSRADFFGEGIAWLVRSEKVHIQARYKATPMTNGLASTDSVAVGGPFLDGHHIKVGPTEGPGRISWDDQPIMTDFPSDFTDVQHGVTMSYNGEGDLLDSAMNKLQRRIVHMNLPHGIHLQVMRWAHHVNVRITMLPEAGGQDGHCGNFNGKAQDDSTHLITERLGKGVSREDSMFEEWVPSSENKALTLADCPNDLRDIARTTCLEARRDLVGAELSACVFDVCFGGDQYAQQDAVY